MDVHLEIDLPAEMIADIKRQVASGRYSSESEMVQTAVRALMRKLGEQKHPTTELPTLR